MMNIRDNKGITLMAEVITIILLLLIVSIITYSSMSSLQVRNLNDMYADIVNIQDKAANYYLKYGKAPVTTTQVPGTVISAMSDELNPNDDGNYYVVNLSNLNNISLNNKQTDENYYFINNKTLTVYYSKGVKVDKLNNIGEKTYHTLPSNYEGIEKLEVGSYQN